MFDRAELSLPTSPTPRGLVLDTNVVLDMFVFLDPHSSGVISASLSPSWTWYATQSMRNELERVLTYLHISERLACGGTSATHVLAQYDARTQAVDAAPRSSSVCKDPDDQMFIDLAVQHRAVLISKDRAVLALKRKLAVVGSDLLSTHEFAG